MAADLKVLATITEDDDLLLLSTLRDGDNVNYGVNDKLNFDTLTNTQCRNLFRFGKNDLHRVKEALELPDKLICRNGTVVHGLEGLCIMLRRLAYPNRLEDISPLFGRSVVELSYILNEMVDFVYDKCSPKLTHLQQNWLTADKFQIYSNAISEKGAPLSHCWGFVDGTIRPICRPHKHQSIVFSGHKRVHGLKFQSVTTPDGIIANLYGPIEGRRHDAGMLRESGLLNQLEMHMTDANDTIYSLYGDLAYPLRPHLIAPFKGAFLTADELEFNKRMAPLRVCVEWSFGKIISLFAFLDYKKKLKLYLQPVAKYYMVASIFTNCHTCLYGSETSGFFGLDPPSLEEYLH